MTKTISLSDAITLQRGFDLPNSQRKTGQYPVITSTGTTSTHNVAKVKGPGVVIGRSGSIGGGQYIAGDFWPLNTTLWVKDFKGNNEKFIYYLLKSLDFSSFNAGAAVPTLNRNHLSALKVRIPERKEQDEIADILGTIDEKIELNRKMNETLEQMGQALFRHYFIDNPMASNWEKKSLDKYVDLVNGASYKSAELKPSINALVTLKSIGRGGGFSRRGYKEFTGKMKDIQIVHDGDLVVAHTDLTQKAEVAGYPALVDGADQYDQVAISMDLVKVISRSSELSSSIIYFLLKTREFQDHKMGYINGSTVLHLNKKCIPDYEIALPNDVEKIHEMSAKFDRFMEQIKVNNQQIHTLTTLRDTLLPRLINGKISLKS